MSTMDTDEALPLVEQYADLTAAHAKLASEHVHVIDERDSLLRENETLQRDVDSLREFVSRYVKGDVTLFTVSFNEDVGRKLETLFQLMDVDGSGNITAADFKSHQMSVFGVEHNAVWEKVRTHLDLDHDNEIFFEEFVRGWAATTRHETVEVLADLTYANYLEQINTTVQAFANRRILSTAEEVVGELAVRSAPAVPIQQAASPMVFRGFLRKDVSVLMTKIFRQLQKSDSEKFITAQSFQRAGANMSDWSEFQRYFDSDFSNSISEAEFLNGFKAYIKNEKIRITTGPRTLGELMHEVEDSASMLIREKLLEFETRRRRSSVIAADLPLGNKGADVDADQRSPKRRRPSLIL
eukprot:m.93640 g.93640  ORF g.93640 m.93640 type:complete len:354 (+) comp26649_c0_seq2:138-1199(+)